MELVRSSLVAAFVVGLVGCASAPKVMEEGEYPRFATAWIGLRKCAALGHVSPDTAARGRTFLTASLNTFSYDKNKLESTIQQAQLNMEPDKSDCADLAIQVAQTQQRVQIHNASVELQRAETQRIIDSTRSKQTYCNRVGNQTFCNSF